MIINVALQVGTSLANVRYKWIISGVLGSEISTGITQPDATLPLFRLSFTIPYGAEELIIYDTTAASTNWNLGSPLLAL